MDIYALEKKLQKRSQGFTGCATFKEYLVSEGNHFTEALSALKAELSCMCDADRDGDQEHIEELDALIQKLEEVKGI